MEIQTEEIPKGNNVTLQILHDNLQGKDNNITVKDYSESDNELKGTYKIDGKEFGFTIDKNLNVKIGDVEKSIEEAFNMTVTNVDKTSLRATGDADKLNELGATEFTYVASTSGSNDIKFEHITTTSYDVTGLEPGTDYTVYMLAYDNAGNVKKSNSVKVTTKNLEIVTTDPYIGTSKTETDATKSVADRSQKKGDPLYINFKATLEGTNCTVTLKDDSSKTLPYEITTNGKFTFVVTGTYGGKTVTKEIEVTVEKFKIYEIYTPQDLQNMSKDRHGDYIVMNDIDMSGFDFKTIRYSENKNSANFDGSIDGQGHTISNLSIVNPAATSMYNKGAGIFSDVNDCTIKNIIFKNIKIEDLNNYECGLIASVNGNSLFEKVGVTGSIKTTGNNGSFAGTSNGTIKFINCYARTTLNSRNNRNGWIHRKSSKFYKYKRS